MTTTMSEKERKLREQLQAAQMKELEQAHKRWSRFVEAELAKIDAADPTRDDLTTERGTTGRAKRTKLSRAEYRELAAIFERRRQQEGYTPDEQGRKRLLHTIANELDGKHADGSPRDNGMALVHFGGLLTEINRERVRRRLNATPLASSAITPKTIGIIVGVAVLFICSGVVLIQTLLSGSAASAPRPTIAIGAQAMPIANLLGAQIDELPLVATLQPAHPAVVCIEDPDALAKRKEATLVLTRSTSIQIYDVTPDQTQADLVLADCQQTPPAVVLAARLRESQAAQPLSSSIVQRVTTFGPDRDPTQIAANQMLVEITLTNTTYADSVLVLADGSRWPVASTQGTTVRYIVPQSDQEQQAALEQPRDDAPPAIIPVSIPAPRRRLAFLQDAVRVNNVQAHQEGDRLIVQATVTLLSGLEPLALLASDATLNGPAGSGVIAWSPPTLHPGKHTTIQLSLPRGNERTQIITIAGFQFSLSN